MACARGDEIKALKAVAWSRVGGKQEWEAVLLPGPNVGDEGCSLSFRRARGTLHFMAIELIRVDEDEEGHPTWPPLDLADPEDHSLECGAADMASGFDAVEDIARAARDPSSIASYFGKGWTKAVKEWLKKPWVIEGYEV